MLPISPAQIRRVRRHEARRRTGVSGLRRRRHEAEAVELSGVVVELGVVRDGVRGDADDGAGGDGDAVVEGEVGVDYAAEGDCWGSDIVGVGVQGRETYGRRAG